MEILKFNSNPDDSLPEKRTSSKKLTATLGIGGLAALAGFGSTLAANITLNNNTNVEFGQGVAQTTSCDSDGFTITPVTRYDNELSMFRIDYVQVSDLNLTPVGTGFDDSDLSSFNYSDAAAAAADHPGQYYDTDANSWINTCDGVVLDFKAYTDNPDYAAYTKDGYESQADTITSPLMWTVDNGDPYENSPYLANSDVAIIFDATLDDNNYGSVSSSSNTGDLDITYPTAYDANSSFTFANYNSWQDPFAGAISKITVETMKYFPDSYSVEYENGVGVKPT